MKKLSFLSTVAVAALAIPVHGFDSTPIPVSPAGVRATVDLPASQHLRNTGGNDLAPDAWGRPTNPGRVPGQGSGLCVFTSGEHAARWQNILELMGFQKWMTKREGGGWPVKFDAMIKAFCAEKGVATPKYLQHEGGEAEFLELALKTDRMPCVTYDGRDGYYRGSVGHMVNLAYLDANYAAIIDNNRPGQWIWMTRAEFLSRWRAAGGGWAIVFLSAPPPPYPGEPVARKHRLLGYDGPMALIGSGGCHCQGPPCQCEQCDCVSMTEAWGGSSPKIEQCGPGGCRYPSSTPVFPSAPTNDAGKPDGWEEAEPDRNGQRWNHYSGGKLTGTLDSTGWHAAAFGGILVKGEPLPADLKPPGDPHLTGVVTNKIGKVRKYSKNGNEIERHEAFAALAGPDFSDDSGRWHLTAVGDATFLAKVRTDLAMLTEETRAKLLFQAYGPTDWPVLQFRLPVGGLSLRKPSPARVGVEIATVLIAEYKPDSLVWLLQQPGGPLPPPPPKPMPSPEPPAPDPITPTPPTLPSVPTWVWPAALLALILWLRSRPSA